MPLSCQDGLQELGFEKQVPSREGWAPRRGPSPDPFHSASGPSALLHPTAPRGRLQALRSRRGQSRLLCLGTEGVIARACAAPRAPPSLCTRGVERPPQGGPLSQAGALGTMKLPALLPSHRYCLCPESLVCVCPVLLPVGTWFINADEGGKQMEFAAHLVSAAHTPLQKDAPPHPPLPPSRLGPAASPTSCQVATESLPSLCTDVGSSPWQVFQDSCSP